MTATYTYARVKQNFDLILKQASRDGKVKIRGKDDQLFIITLEKKTKSPLDIESVHIDMTVYDIIQTIHESRRP